MIFLIDGHNLIPKIPGLSLRDLDDEQGLVELLQKFARIARKRIEVYFDDAAAGQAGNRNAGTLKIHFIQKQSTADDAIIKRIHSSGKNAQAITVVTSDHRIQVEARVMHVKVIESADFAAQIQTAIMQYQGNVSNDQKLEEEEVEDWLEIFEQRKMH